MSDEGKVDIEQAMAEEGKIEPLKPTIYKIVNIAPAFRDQLVNYLETKPHKEVNYFVTNLKAAQILDVTVNG